MVWSGIKVSSRYDTKEVINTMRYGNLHENLHKMHKCARKHENLHKMHKCARKPIPFAGNNTGTPPRGKTFLLVGNFEWLPELPTCQGFVTLLEGGGGTGLNGLADWPRIRACETPWALLTFNPDSFMNSNASNADRLAMQVGLSKNFERKLSR